MSNVHHPSSKSRLDQELVRRGLIASRSQAESFIKLGKVTLNGKVATKAGALVAESDEIKLTASEQYVNRAALKLASVSKALQLDFRDKTVLDVGSSTGGFTDYALKHGAAKVIAVDVGTDQMHPSLRNDPRVELHEKLDIRHLTLDVGLAARNSNVQLLTSNVDIVVIDVSFISLREILPHLKTLCNANTDVVAMVKPQFEAGDSLKHKGVIKNDKIRRNILKDFEVWVQKLFVVVDKADSEVHGTKGNIERFYLLKPLN